MSLIRQQAKVELGDDFIEVRKQCLGYLRFILSRGWVNKAQVVNAEGGSAHMLDDLLARVVAEGGDIKAALRGYGTYLVNEYGQDAQHNKCESLDSLVAVASCDPTPASWIETKNKSLANLGRGDTAVLAAESPALKGLQLIEDMSHVERDVMETIASIGAPRSVGRRRPLSGGVREAAALIGIPYDEARRAYRRVKARAKRDPLPL